MDPAEEIPQLVHPEKKPHLDGEASRDTLTQAAAVAKLFDDGNLLREIIVGVGFPTTLVRAALVCKRWLAHASDPKFLSRFRKLHPPRLLGYYITEWLVWLQWPGAPRFVPLLPQPPELTTVISRLESYTFGTHHIMQFQNGGAFTMRRNVTEWMHRVHHPLCPQKGMQIVPPFPHTQDHNRKIFSAMVSKEEGSSCSYFYLLGESRGEAGNSMARVYMLQDGVWRLHTSATCFHALQFDPKALLIDNKIYMPSASGDGLIVLDLTASNFSRIQLPEGVKYCDFNSRLSREDDDSSVYFIHVEEFQLRVWLNKGRNWLLVDTICLHEMLDILGMSDHTLEDKDIAMVQIIQVGDNGQCVFLRMGKCLIYLDIKCRMPSKLYEDTVNDRFCCSIHPVMMVWPPTFPALKGDHASMVSDGE